MFSTVSQLMKIKYLCQQTDAQINQSVSKSNVLVSQPLSQLSKFSRIILVSEIYKNSFSFIEERSCQYTDTKLFVIINETIYYSASLSVTFFFPEELVVNVASDLARNANREVSLSEIAHSHQCNVSEQCVLQCCPRRIFLSHTLCLLSTTHLFYV